LCPLSSADETIVNLPVFDVSRILDNLCSLSAVGDLLLWVILPFGLLLSSIAGFNLELRVVSWPLFVPSVAFVTFESPTPSALPPSSAISEKS
jgi:hypothetical protein